MIGWRRSVSIIVQRDGALQSTTYRIPVWALRGALVVGVAILVLLVLGVAFYGPIARQAVRVPQLEGEVDRLRIENLRVRALAAALDSLEMNYDRLRKMVGADIVPDPVMLGHARQLASGGPGPLCGRPGFRRSLRDRFVPPPPLAPR